MRQTSEQIDRSILEVAAGIFAQYGYANTSLQQIADAVGYSKAGILHRFGSKEALYRSVVTYGTELYDEVFDLMAAVPEGDERMRDMFLHLGEFAADHPGMLRMALEIFQKAADFPDVEDVIALSLKLLTIFDVPVGDPSDNLRLALSLNLLSQAVLSSSLNSPLPLELPRHQLIPFAVELALAVLESPVAVTS